MNNFYQPGLDPTTAQRFDIRVDWTQSEKQRIFGRFSFDRLFTSTYNAFGNEWDLNYAQNVTNGRNILLADDSDAWPDHGAVVALLLHPPLRKSGWRSEAGRIRHYHPRFSRVAGRGGGLQASALRDFQRCGRRCGWHGELQHVSICQREQRRERFDHQGEGQTRDIDWIRIHEAVPECGPAAGAFRLLCL